MVILDDKKSIISSVVSNSSTDSFSLLNSNSSSFGSDDISLSKNPDYKTMREDELRELKEKYSSYID